MTAADVLREYAGRFSGGGEFVQGYRLRALADLVEACSRWDRLGDCRFCTGDRGRGHDCKCPLAAVERVFSGESDAKTEQ